VPWGGTTGGIRFVSIDENGNPVVLCNYNYTTEWRIYHWDGSSWGDYLMVPNTIMAENGNYYRNINDFEYNPITGDYLITTYYDPPKFYAIDQSGTIVHSDNDIWNTAGTEDIYSGLYVDKDSPACRIIFNGAPYIPLNGPHYGETYFARCNPVYGEWTYSTTPEGNYPFRDGRGSVVKVGGSYYFCGTSSYRWYSTYIAVPEWG
jgi:hypothetical protein